MKLILAIIISNICWKLLLPSKKELKENGK
mgnify:CR=1 FL=1